MTSFSRIVKKQIRNQFNKKDGVRSQTSQDLAQFRDPTFEELGFSRTDAGWTYTWEDVSPVFSLSFGRSGAKWGYTAKCGEVTEFWPLWAAKSAIRDRIDDLIYSLVQWAAYADDDLVDIDRFMSDLPQEQETEQALWVTI